MAKIRVKVIGSGKEGDPFRVNLPTYSMVPGSEEYSDPGKKILKSVEVDVPDSYLGPDGKLDKARIRSIYKGQPRWDRVDLLSDV